ncbi:hypothetical protein [Niveispirillum irakense]|uniref:hypothetical protein n=1 Tax=Niveispirillum irakense TaxID=34011 RepID=UPI0012B5FCC0|nr:hypothetical protein [Niveispirillum irakense]
MKALLGVAALIAMAWGTTAYAAVEADAICPVLPSESGLSWSLKRGPDFYVCYAEDKGTISPGLIGVYLGLAPSFVANNEAFVGEGLMDGMPVRWQRKPVDGYKFGLESLRGQMILEAPLEQSDNSAIEPPPPPPPQDIGHIWVLSNDELTLESLRAVAEKLRFKPTRRSGW